MIKNYFSSLIIHQKCHTDQDTNAIRGQWKLGRVSNVEKGNEGYVKNCHVKHKLFNSDSSINKKFTTICCVTKIDSNFTCGRRYCI